MKVRIRYFASYAELFGREEEALELTEGSTVADCVAALASRPEAARLPPRPLVAVNLRYARPELVLRDGDEVAVIPPVAGG